MPSEDTKILEFNQYEKYDKAPFINLSDLECIIEKIVSCKTNPEKSFTSHLQVIYSHLRGKGYMTKFWNP